MVLVVGNEGHGGCTRWLPSSLCVTMCADTASARGPFPFHSATTFLAYFPVCSWFFTCPVFSADQKERQGNQKKGKGARRKRAGEINHHIMILRSRRRPPVLLAPVVAGRTHRLLTSHLQRSLVSLAQEG